MKTINATHYLFFSYGLDIKKPWFIYDIVMNDRQKDESLTVKIMFEEKEIIRCPVCGADCIIDSVVEKTCRHIDFFNKKCFISVNIPKINCEKDGILTLNTKFGRNNSDFSSCLEDYILLNSHFIPIKEISNNLDISEKIVWNTVLKNIGAECSASKICSVNNLLADETAAASSAAFS